MNGEKESFNLLEIPSGKQRNPSTIPLPVVHDTSSASVETKKSNVSVPLLKTPEHETTPFVSQVSCTSTSNEQVPAPPPSQSLNPPRSRLSGFSLPLFSSTPLNQGLFSQKRRTSSKKGRKQTSATTPTNVEAAPQTPVGGDKKEEEEQKCETDSADKSILPADQPEEKLPLTAKLSVPKSPKEKTEIKTPVNVAKAFDLEDLHRTQRGLLTLLDDFSTGKLKVFQNDSAMRSMKQVREKQERLAKLHFELYAAQDHLGVSTETARVTAFENLQRLVTSLQDLNVAVQTLDNDTRPITPAK